MQLQVGQILELLDARQRPLGKVTLEGREDDLLLGRFTPGPAFASVEPLFRDFEEAANTQALAVVDKLDAAIAALGLRLAATDKADGVDIKDVQIWSDGGVTCRLSHAIHADRNGGLGSSATFTPEVSA